MAIARRTGSVTIHDDSPQHGGSTPARRAVVRPGGFTVVSERPSAEEAAAMVGAAAGALGALLRWVDREREAGGPAEGVQ